MSNKNAKRSNPADRRNGKGKSALLLIDIISDFDFEDGAKLHSKAIAAAVALAELKKKAAKAHVPVIYVNDNFGNWQEDFESQVERIIDSSAKGREIAELLRPGREDYYVLKPQRSGFFETPLAVLLASLDVSDVIVTGFTTDICVLFTAHDAYMRGFGVRVPEDCSAAVGDLFHKNALEFLARVARVDTAPSTQIELKEEPQKVLTLR